MSSYGKCMDFPITGKCNKTKPMLWEKSGKLILILFPQNGCFFQLDSHPMAYFIIWEMHGFPHQFPTLQENATKPIVWEETGKLVLILFPQCGCFFPLDSHPMVYFIAWKMHGFSHQISNSIRKVSRTHQMGKAWEICSHTFSKNRCFFSLDSHPVVYFIIWEMHGFYHQFSIAQEKGRKYIKWAMPGKLAPGKILQNPPYVQNLGNWYSYFSQSMSAFFPLDSHPMVNFIICEIHGFPHQFPKP